MIKFACKKFDLNEVIRCGLGISRAEYRIFKVFLSKKGNYFKTEEISKILNLDISTVQRAVKKLHDLEVLQRNQNNLSGGGYVFMYEIRDKKEIREKILSTINSWNKKVEAEFDEW